MTPPCPDCRERPCPTCALASLVPAAPVTAPAGFADRAFVAVVRDRRRRQALRRGGRLGVAAALLLGVGLAAGGLGPRDRIELAEVAPTPASPRTPAPDPIGDARAAFVSVTQRAGETALAPTRNLLAGVGEPAGVVALPPEVPTPTVSVAVLDPLTDTTRRAVSFFLKDVRQLASAEPEASR